MVYKTITGVSEYMAKIAQHDYCANELKRWVYRVSDFTSEDRKMIKSKAEEIKKSLLMSNDKNIHDVMISLKAIMPYTFIGFRLQQEIIDTCSHCGVSITL